MPHNQKQLAESYGVTQQTMNNYMRMASMIPELEDLVDTGIVTKDTALAIINNFGRRKNDPSKDRKALETYVFLRGYKHGEIGGGHQRCQNGMSGSTLDEIAKELNMSKRNLQRALRIERNLTDSMKVLLDKKNIKNILRK
ncbi:MAG: hypothetical protein IJE43_01895 [Alphaproteobacteria bacterium]|nr:hypothetical protein [Alphaproteobacteria bacterium]MBQ3512534.1 hypothetical protein [Lachnospiraceae bacterium]